jgi:FkbM family methyltransferase
LKFIRNALPRPLKILLRRHYLELYRALTGTFPYCNQNIYSPASSVIFNRIADAGIYEPEIIDALVALAKPYSLVFDVGANIGVITAAILSRRSDLKVVAFDCSPSTLPFLRKTHAISPHKTRWCIVETAVADRDGVLPFSTRGPENSAYDGLKDTKRGGAAVSIAVSASKLDTVWDSLGRPHVSLIKMDIEGGEFSGFLGARELIATCRPYIVFEWNPLNLRAYDRDPADIFSLPIEGYDIFTLPSLGRVNRSLLALQLMQTEMFLAAPTEGN